jgi:hypothetical protein
MTWPGTEPGLLQWKLATNSLNCGIAFDQLRNCQSWPLSELIGESIYYIEIIWWPTINHLAGPVRGARTLHIRCTTHVQTCSTVDKPIGQQIAKKTHPHYRRCQKWAVLLCTPSRHLHIKYTFPHWSYFSEKERAETWNPDINICQNLVFIFHVGIMWKLI